MAKKRKGKKRPQGRVETVAKPAAPVSEATPTPESKPAPAKPAKRVEPKPAAEIPEPRFWFGFEVPWAKLVVARFVIFGLLAVDALLQIWHAPRYGAGGFNVAHFPLLGYLAPGHTGYEIGQLVCAYLFALVACGAIARFVLPLATALYGWLYFTSQLDSYQHHYLVFLFLLLACFVPWRRPDGATPETPVRSWALRLVLVQLAILYLWAAISKITPAWLDGRTLSAQVTGATRDVLDATIGIKRAARISIAVEFALALGIWNKRLWPYAAPLGILFHLGILFGGLEIGLFAYLMLGFYLLVIPDRVYVWLANTPPIVAARRVATRVAASVTPRGRIAWIVALALGGPLFVLARYDHALVAGLLVTLLALAIGLASKLRLTTHLATLAAAHLVALGLWLAVDRTTSVTEKYYRLLGGTARRFGTADEAEHAYRKLVDIVPDSESPHYQLGRILLAREATEAGLAELHEAQRVAPQSARAFIAEAQWLANRGRTPEAIEKARAAKQAEPTNQRAIDLLNSLSQTGSAGTLQAAPDDD